MKKTIYRRTLNSMSPRQWEHYLREHSSLTNASVNMELAHAFSCTGTLMDFQKYLQIKSNTAEEEGTADSFLLLCGLLGIGNYLTKYWDDGLFMKLKYFANDSRASIRGGVVTALEMIGKKDLDRFVEKLTLWVNGSYLEQYAAVKSLCNFHSSIHKKTADNILDILDLITVNLLKIDAETAELTLLKTQLSRLWSKTVTVSPQKGKTLMERWIKENDATINQIMNANLEKLKLLEPDWTKSQLAKLTY